MWNVCIIGSGGAALCAALGSSEHATKVLLLSKSKLGLGNCTAVSGGNFRLATEPYDHETKTRETGQWINDPQLVNILVEEGYQAVMGLQRYGVKFKIIPSLATVAPYAARRITAGTAFTLPLVQAIRQNTNIHCQERALVTDIVACDNGVWGVQYLNLKTGSLEWAMARAVVVATGGAGQLYARTDNPTRTTGDGYALLFKLGLEFKDMEFVQFFPIALAGEGLPSLFIPLSFIDKVPLTNGKGVEFLKQRLREWGLQSGIDAERYARDRCAREVAQEIAAGHNVYLHLNLLPREEYGNAFMADLERITYGKFDLRNKPLPVAPTQHFFCGGVVTGAEGQTIMPGLFACGEVVAGLHGANRIGGNALTELVVFGFRAGKAAAAHASGIKAGQALLPRGKRSPLEKWKQGQGRSPRLFKSKLQELSWHYLGVLRTGHGLQTAICKLEQLGAWIDDFCAPDIQTLQHAIEVENLYLTALMVAKAALEREESRGVHYRKDFPNQDDINWKRSVVISKGQDGRPQCAPESRSNLRLSRT